MKSKWMVAILIVALPLLLAACGIKVVVVGTPTPKPTAIPTATRTLPQTAMPEPTSTPGTTSVATPAPQPSPALPANLPTPDPKINLKEMGNRLGQVVSFAFDYTDEENKIRLQGVQVQAPSGRWVRQISETGDIDVEHVKIGDRQWARMMGLVFSCVDWQQLPEDSPVLKACLASLTLTLLIDLNLADPLARGQEATLVPGITTIDSTQCYQYEWRDADGNLSRICLAAETGLPLLFESPQCRWSLSHFNDPANVIAPPVSEMPAKLHIDDARMALNSLASFRYVTVSEFGDEGNLNASYIEGIYLQANQAWQADFRSKHEDPNPLVQLLSIRRQTWERYSAGGAWTPVSTAKNLAGDADPFAAWPGGPTMPVALTLLDMVSSRTVSGLECVEYLSNTKFQTSQGAEWDIHVRLCVTAAMVPLRMEISGTSGSSKFTITRELSHLDDPANVVEKAE